MRVIHLTTGAGNGVDKACLMTAANMLIGRGEDGDNCYCVCPVIRAFIIRTNDAIGSFSEKLLGELYTPLIWEILGTKSDQETERKRAFYFAGKAVRVLAPIALDSCGFSESANELRCLPEVIDLETANAARAAAYAAANAADAVAYPAVYAAYAAADAANADNEKENVFRLFPDIILGAIAIGDKRPVETVCSLDEIERALA